MNEWLFVNLPVKTDAVFVSAVWVRYDGKEPNKQSERSVSQHFPSPPLLSLPKTMPQLLLKSSTVVYFHATYMLIWKATFKQEKQNKTVCSRREEQNILVQESYSRGTNPRLAENSISLEMWWHLNQDHPVEAEIQCTVFLVLKCSITRITG